MSTIAGIATGLINSGVSIIRISGKDSLSIISKMFSNANKLKPNTIIYGNILDLNHHIMDNALVSYFKAPYSFTGEDVCEINCHGGKQITLEILEEVLRNGAILAEPGEFSKRAFLNGKMDLSQAEAIIDLITSKTKIQSKIAIKQLEGGLSKVVKSLRDQLIEILAQIEVSIDYPEYDYEEVSADKVSSIIDSQISQIDHILNKYEEGKYIKSGVNVAILGVPNVGKSSLLNKLARYEKAIVTDVPGTTRDIVEETLSIGDLVLNISDTAGIRETDDIVEKIGVERSIKKLDEVDLVIYMISADKKIKEIDLEMLSKIKNKGIKTILAINKIDKKEKSIFSANMNEIEKIGVYKVIEVSIQEDIGIENLKEAISSMFMKHDFDYNDEFMLVNKRHKDLLARVRQNLEHAKYELNQNKSIDIISISLKHSAKSLGEIIGADVSQDIISKIFEKFCLGK